MTDMHIDHKVLSDLREVMEDGYLQLVQTFLDDSERRLGQLHAAKSAEELARQPTVSRAAAATWARWPWPACASSSKSAHGGPRYMELKT